MIPDQNNEPPHDAGPTLDALIERLVDQMTTDLATAHATGDAIIPAGHAPPSPSSLADVGIAHAIDGDGDSLCRPHIELEQIDNHYWNDVPSDQRCLICAATLDMVSP